MKTNALIAALLVAWSIPAAGAEDDTSRARVGETAPEFTITTLDGKTISTGDLEGKVTYFYFFATWCGGCMKRFPSIDSELWPRFKDNEHFQMAIVGREHTEAELTEFKAEQKAKAPLAADPERGIYGQFASSWVPRQVVIGPEGTIIAHENGSDDDKYARVIRTIEDALNDLGHKAAE